MPQAPLRPIPRLVTALAIALALFSAVTAHRTRHVAAAAPVAAAPSAHAGMVSARVPAPGRLTATLYDLAGTRVRVLAADAPHARGDVRFAWDGRDETGRPVRAGAYALKLEVTGRNVRAESVTHVRWPVAPGA